jgi:hypothetical protein
MSTRILIALSAKGIDAISISAPDAPDRLLGYLVCSEIEKELGKLGEIVQVVFKKYQQKEEASNA